MTLLKENFYNELDFETEEFLNSIKEEFKNYPYSELAIIVSSYRALKNLFYSYHWTASGESSYSDHLLFERIYESFEGYEDQAAEKLLALGGSPLLLNPILLSKASHRFIHKIETCDYPNITIAAKGLKAIKLFIQITDSLRNTLRQKGNLSTGTDNLLGDILDSQEKNLYLLERRIRES